MLPPSWCSILSGRYVAPRPSPASKRPRNRAFVVWGALLQLVTAAPAFTEGINLSWDECGAAGSELKTFACNSNTPSTLVASFVPPAGITELLGLQAEVVIASQDMLPDWWKHGVGGCRGTTGLSTSFSFLGDTTCADFMFGGAFGGHDYRYEGNTARLRLAAAVATTAATPASPNTEYYAFKVHLLPKRSPNTECPGCEKPVRISLTNIQLFQTPTLRNDPVLAVPLIRNAVYWQEATQQPLQIREFTPAHGAPGTAVTIIGAGFTSASAVRFNTIAAEFRVISDVVITATVPAGARTGRIQVVTAQYQTTSNAIFLVAPIIHSFEPQEAPPSHPVTITGHNFTGTTAVLFNGSPAAFEIESDSLIRTSVPQGASEGPITVINPAGTSTSSERFRVSAPSEIGNNLARNPSFESFGKGWIAIGRATLKRIADAHDGAVALQVVGPDSAGDFGINDVPSTVKSLPAAGRKYRFSAWVKAPAPGTTVRLRVKEYVNRVPVQSISSMRITPDASWQAMQMDVTGREAGSVLSFQVVGNTSQPRGEFHVDDISIRKVGSRPVLQAPARVTAHPGSPVEIIVTAADPKGVPMSSLAADLSDLPMGNEATFTADPGNSRGVLRWTPQPTDGDWAYNVRFVGTSILDGEASTRITVSPATADPSPIVRNSSFEEPHTKGWHGIAGSSLSRLSPGRASAWGLLVRGPDTTATFGMSDNPNWVSGATNLAGGRFRFSCWMRGENGTGVARLRIREFRDTTKVGLTTNSPKLELSSTWRQLVVDHVTQETGTSLDLQIVCDPTSPGAAFLVDDVSIRPIAPVKSTSLALHAVGSEALEPARVFPNPFRDRATLAWSLARPGPVRADIYDVIGRRVRTIFESQSAEPGLHHFALDRGDGRGERLGPGLFFYRIVSGEKVQHGRFVVLE
jgi:hypothetical protein